MSIERCYANQAKSHTVLFNAILHQIDEQSIICKQSKDSSLWSLPLSKVAIYDDAGNKIPEAMKLQTALASIYDVENIECVETTYNMLAHQDASYSIFLKNLITQSDATQYEDIAVIEKGRLSQCQAVFLTPYIPTSYSFSVLSLPKNSGMQSFYIRDRMLLDIFLGNLVYSSITGGKISTMASNIYNNGDTVITLELYTTDLNRDYPIWNTLYCKHEHRIELYFALTFTPNYEYQITLERYASLTNSTYPSLEQIIIQEGILSKEEYAIYKASSYYIAQDDDDDDE